MSNPGSDFEPDDNFAYHGDEGTDLVSTSLSTIRPGQQAQVHGATPGHHASKYSLPVDASA